ncbi:cortactin-binding protein 2-like [Cajanus cajan]|uniref:cortactin-binding protein 2-like n=1 Tax=Cajanus cajan TaxID=3821 RepID=UPI00098D8723|nr:cortactin-binding protein 2-like [Cajanus cajan]
MIETAELVEGLNSVEVFLQRTMAIVDHWKHKWSKQQEDLAKLKGRVQPLREENKALKEENRALAGALGDAKLQSEVELQATRRELERVHKSLEIALRSNETHAAQVSELQELANSSRGRVRALEDEVTSLKVDLVVAAEKHLCDEVLLGGKEEEVVALRVDLSKMATEKAELEKKLEGTKRVVLFEHKRGFLKVTSKAVGADAVDLTGSSPPEGAPQAAAEEVAQATEVRHAAEVPVVPSSKAPVVEQGAPASTSAEVHKKGPSSEVPTPTPTTSAPPSGSSKGPPRNQYLAHRFRKDHSLVRLDHVSASEDIDSLWSAG